LLGRSYESRREYDLAIEQYQQEDSNQMHGNLIRTRLLKAAVEKAYPGVSLDSKADGSGEEVNDKSSEAKQDAAEKVKTEEMESVESESEGAETEEPKSETEEPKSETEQTDPESEDESE